MPLWPLRASGRARTSLGGRRPSAKSLMLLQRRARDLLERLAREEALVAGDEDVGERQQPERASSSISRVE